MTLRRNTALGIAAAMLDFLVAIDLDVTDIGANRIVGIAHDELGVEYIRVYELQKPHEEPQKH